MFIKYCFFKNIIISGCAIYPVSKLCLQNLEWSNVYQVKDVSQENEAWTKGWPDYKNTDNISQAQYSKDFNWIDTWSKTHLIKINKILLPYFLLLTFIYLFIYFKFKDKNIISNSFHNRKYLILILLSI